MEGTNTWRVRDFMLETVHGATFTMMRMRRKMSSFHIAGKVTIIPYFFSILHLEFNRFKIY